MNAKQTAKGLLNRLTRPLAAIGRRLTTREENEAEQTATSAEPFDDRLVEDTFSLTLEEMLTEDAGRFQVKLQIISLVQFREAVGDKWARLSEKVMLIAEGVIAQHLGAGNVSGRQGQDFFVLLFRTVPHAEGRRRSILIAQELGTRLLGNQFIAGDQPLALAAELDLADAIGPDGRLNPSALASAIDATRAEIAHETAKEGTRREPNLVTDLNGGIRRSLMPGQSGDNGEAVDRTAETAWAGHTEYRDGEPVDPRWKAMRTAAPRPQTEPEWKPLETEKKRTKTEPDWKPLETARRLPEGHPDSAPPMPADAVLTLTWRPTWMGSTETLGAYQARISRVDQPGQTPRDGSRAYPSEGGDTALALDRTIITNAVRELCAADTPIPRAALILPLHWASVSSARRLSLLAPLADLIEGQRGGRIIFELFGMPDDLATRDLNDTIQALRPLCREVMIRVSIDQPRAARAADCHASAIGVDLDELFVTGQADDDTLLDALAGLHQKADAAGLGVYAWGLRRRALVTGTVMGGYSLINGPGLMKDLSRPARALPAPRSRFAKA
ncbi:hypothetical protein [Magnetospirillum molischianum]|uniref:Uncharacterized protein n=1 Tax=Magnetospirillum molischianum DSM 120 TaxID=1150626 RepID=H8FRG3_MAGML|nr:hypothetical protein [Magnetospirillum molischianum]CCG40951.1 conserved hypothetical protein [Magnetospirillum molischianum DSM 120]